MAIVIPKDLPPALADKYREIYQSKGASHAANWAKNNITIAKQGGAAAGVVPGAAPGNGTFVSPGIKKPDVAPDGTVNGPKALQDIIDQATNDFNTKFAHNNPDQVDQYGNTLKYVRNPDGTISAGTTAGEKLSAAQKKYEEDKAGYKGIDLSGAPKVLTEGDLTDTYQKDYDARFANATQFNDRNQARDLEDTRQELAHRGIPFDPAQNDPNNPSGYAKAISGVKEHYDALNRTAMNDATAYAHGDVAQQVDSSVKGYNAWLAGQTAGDSSKQFILNADHTALSDYGANSFTPFQGGGDFSTAPYIAQIDALQSSGAISAADAALKKQQLAEQTRVDTSTIGVNAAQANKLNKSGSGSSSGSKSSGNSSGGGFEIVS